jgi:LAO/AO transport system kinase
MLSLGLRDAAVAWQVPVIATSAVRGDGVGELLAAIDRHRAMLDATGAIETRRAQIAERRLLKAGEEILRDRFERQRDGRFAGLLDQLRTRVLSPHAAADRLLDELQTARREDA